MADKKISQLTALSAANVAPATDVLAIVDTSATETKKITAKDLIDGALNGGTANGVLYLNGSKVATSGSALTFDGTTVLTTPRINVTNTGIGATFSSSGGSGLKVYGSSGTNQWDIYLNGANVRFSDNTGGGAVKIDTNAIIDGNLGLGVTPSAWSSGKAIQIGSGAADLALFCNNNDSNISSNAYVNSGWKYQWATSVPASRYQQTNGTHIFYTAPSGTAGNTISWTQALTLDANVNLLLNGTTAPASGVGTFAIFNGTAPTGSVTNGCVLYTEDVSSSSELKVRDEAGNVTTLSPHNFSLIPEGASENMAWAYYSEKNGNRINVDMLKLARMVEKLTGEKLVYEA